MDLRWSVRHPEFSIQAGNRCSELQRPALKLKVDTSMLQAAYVHIIFFLVFFGVGSSSVRLAAHFSFILYNLKY
jgi:hypothetical protein